MTRLSTEHPESNIHFASQAAASTPTLWRDYYTLTKPRITRMVAITSAIGFLLASPVSMFTQGFAWIAFFSALLGTSFACMGASVLNQVYERDTDALMPRTMDRPLAAGRINAHDAMAMGLLLSVLGVAILWLGANGLSAMACLFTIMAYTHVYTPLKRISWTSTHIGAIPGAMPPVIGAAAASTSIGIEAALLFAIMLIWQVPHFLAIGWMYREDYAKANMPLLSVIDPTGKRTFRQTFITTILMVLVSLLPWMLGVSGVYYLIVASVLGVWFLWLGIRLMREKSTAMARKLFFASLLYLPVVLGAMLLDRVG